jgi:hypothetical protein
MKNAILINSANQSVTLVKVGEYTDIYTHLGNDCSLFACPITFENNDTLYVDDEGLYHPFEGGFMLKDWSYPIVGNGLILGTDDEGDSADCHTTIEDIMAQIVWVSQEDAQQWSEESQNAPFTFISF